MRHTPGPWEFNLQVICDGIDDNGNKINPHTVKDYFEIKGGEGYWRENDNEKGFNITGYMSEANARLISASPDLLKALEEAYEELKFHDWHTSRTGRLIDDTIKRARNQE